MINTSKSPPATRTCASPANALGACAQAALHHVRTLHTVFDDLQETHVKVISEQFLIYCRHTSHQVYLPITFSLHQSYHWWKNTCYVMFVPNVNSNSEICKYKSDQDINYMYIYIYIYIYIHIYIIQVYHMVFLLRSDSCANITSGTRPSCSSPPMKTFVLHTIANARATNKTWLVMWKT